MSHAQVCALQFNVISPEEIKKMAVINVTESKAGATKNSVNDPKLGPLDPYSACETCGQHSKDCPGHFGMIKLEVPVFHPKYFGAVVKILKSICHKCYRCLIPKDRLELCIEIFRQKRKNRLTALYQACEKFKRCYNCSATVKKIVVKDKLIYFQTENETIHINAEHAHRILSSIPSEDVKILGMNEDLIEDELYENPDTFPNPKMKHRHEIRPEWLIFTIFPVSPSAIRPRCNVGDEVCPDDLTVSLNTIVKCNEKLKAHRLFLEGKKKAVSRKKRGKLSEAEKTKTEDNLAYHIHTYIDNKEGSAKAGGGKNRNARAVKSLEDRMDSKDGRFRREVQSKRDDFSGRTVIGGDPTLKLNQLIIPEEIAKTLSVPIPVKEWNVDAINQLIKQKKINTISFKPGVITDLRRGKYAKETVQITQDVSDPHVRIDVERQLQDGDVVIFNRQPTLRVESMMAMEVLVKPGKTFRFNLAVCACFNADFDGDEMNIHVPQNPYARIEAYRLMNANKHIVTPQRDAPIIGPIQDSLKAGYFLSDRETRVPRDVAMNIAFAAGLEGVWFEVLKRAADTATYSGLLPYSKNQPLPGRVLLSLLFPEGFEFRKETCLDDKEKDVVIYNGIWIEGKGDKGVFGAKRNSLIHKLFCYYGETRAQQYIDRYSFMAIPYITYRGASVGPRDLETVNSYIVQEKISESMIKVNLISSQEHDPLKREKAINGQLNNILNAGKKLVDEGLAYGVKNAFNAMLLSGAKGSPANPMQILGCVGQQNIKGKRVPKRITGGTRTLPCFRPGEDTPESRGFVANNYLSGLSPQENFFHAMAGREGIVDTSCGTADTGYKQRQIGKKLEDISVKKNGVVTDGNGNICQFEYGNDGMNARYLFSTSNGLLFTDPVGIASTLVTDEVKKPLLDDFVYDLVNSIALPKVSEGFEGSKDVTHTIRKTLYLELRKVMLPEDPYYYQCFKKRIISDFSKALISRGEAVGLVASASIAEPATQQTLNTFHSAGCSEKDVTLGVPKIKEMLDLSKKPKTPSCTVYYKEETLKNLSSDNKMDNIYQLLCLGRQLEHLKISDLYEKKPELFYVGEECPAASPVLIQFLPYKKYKEGWWVKYYKKVEKREISYEKDEDGRGVWVVTLYFNLEKLYQYRISLSKIARIIENKNIGKIDAVYSPDTEGRIDLVISYSESVRPALEKVKLREGLVTNENINYYFAREVVAKKVGEFYVQGIKGITKTYSAFDEKADELHKMHFVETQGSNFVEVLALIDVDKTITTSDNVWEIYSTLGVCAAREFMIMEFQRVLGFDGTYINPRHIEILVDAMFRRGMPTSVARHGIDKSVGPIGKACYEETTTNLANAACFTEIDNMTSVSARIAMGSLVNIGCGSRN